MKRHDLLSAIQSTLAVTAGMLTLAASAAVADDWRGYHGPGGTCVAQEQEKGPPTSFGPNKNIAWKMALPGRGPSSPIVAGERVFVTAASGAHQDRLHVLAFDTAKGQLLWQRNFWATGHTVCHPFGGAASPTPTSNGSRVIAFFSSNDLVCFDLEGNLKWLRGLGAECPTTRNDVGMSSSPLVTGELVVVQAENQGESFVAAIEIATGKTRWRVERPREATWTSPMLLRGKTPAEDLVVVQSRPALVGYRAQTGQQVWEHPAACHTVSTATIDGSKIFLPAGFGLSALECGREGIQSLWQQQKLRCENCSPVVHRGRMYTIKSPGILVCGEAATGNVLWQLRLTGPFWATPVVAGKHLYAVNHGGLVQVVAIETEGTTPGKVAGTGQIDPEVLATPAVADGAVYLRTPAHLWKIQ